MVNDPKRQTLGKRSFAYRYPRFFIVTGVTISVCIMFSKPIYDIFFVKPQPQENIKIRDRL